MNRLHAMGDMLGTAILTGVPVAVIATISVTVSRKKLNELFQGAAMRLLQARRNQAPARHVAMLKSAVDLIRARQHLIDHKRMTIAEAMATLDRTRQRRPVLAYAKAA